MAKQISLRELFTGLDKDVRHAKGIRIPNLQRDYAYGRMDSQTIEKRDEFITKIEDYLCSNKEPLFHMDYVFGSIVDDGFFILVDGQQRLTTLFLLYLYFSFVDVDSSDKYKNIIDFKNTMSINGESRLIYETRESSKDFCNALINEENLKELFDAFYSNNTEIKLSECITNQKWFFYHWKNDNTINGMLVFLDAIHEKFRTHLCSGYYSKLDSFVFEAVDLNNTSSSENSGEYTVEKAGELYIKMNSRGKRLTRYENLKNNIGDYYDHTIYEDKIMPLLDVKCTDALWNYYERFNSYVNQKKKSRNKDIKKTDFVDQGLLTLINLIIINEYALSSDERNIAVQIIENDIKRWFGKEKDELIIPFTEYAKLFRQRNKDNDGEIIYKLLPNLYSCINSIFEENDNKEVLRWLPKDFIYYNENDTFSEMLDLANSTAIHLNRLKFYAYYLFLEKYYIRKDEDDVVFLNNYKDWMRLACNLINNSFEVINSWGTYITALNSINSICGFGLEECFDKMTKSTGFRETVFLEEKDKAKLIIRDRKEKTGWEKAIVDAEKELYSYFSGQVRFPLDCCKGDINKFKVYVNKFRELFTDDYCGKALLSDCEKDGEFVRCLLSECSDTEYYYDVSDSDCIDLYGYEGGKDKDWSRYCRNAKQEQLAIFKKVIDKLIEGKSFSDIINQNKYNTNNGQNNEWRIMIIDSPELFEYIKNPDADEKETICFFGAKRRLLIKYDGIFSLNNPDKKQINARHKEYYSYKEYCRLCKSNETGVVYVAGPNYNGAYVEKSGQKYFGIDWVNDKYIKANAPW